MPSDSPSIIGRAAIANGEGHFSIETIAVRPPAAGEVRVRLKAAGVCHTDHASLRWPGPLVMGHEGAGVVEAVGEGVEGLEPGQPVLLNWAIPCGHCPQCDRGSAPLCERTLGRDAALGSSAAGAGHTLWNGRAVERSFNLGTFAEYTLVRREAVTPLPASIPFPLACILGCGVMTGVGSAINIAKVERGESVVVMGCGGVGLSAIQGARIAGAGRIIAIDLHESRLARAAELGATRTIQARTDDEGHAHLIEAVLALTGGRGADHAFEATGRAALAFLPLRLVRDGGNALQLSGAHGEVSVPMPWFMWNKRYLTPLYGGCVPERDFPRLFDWAASGALSLEPMVDSTYRLDELGHAFDDMLAGRSTKGVILFD
jgi:S-(hydroxymethyl)glutathione dehydrogenase/alcohol dehydrogenase